QYTIVTPRRDALAATLKSEGIPTAIYYPRPLHHQTAYKHFLVAGNGAPVSERLSAEVLSLPMHAYLDSATQNRIIKADRAGPRSGQRAQTLFRLPITLAGARADQIGAEPLAGRADPADSPCRIADDQRVINDIPRDHRARAHHRKASDHGA